MSFERQTMARTAAITLALGFTLIGPTLAIAAIGDTEIATWFDNRKGALSLTIDDALDDRADTLAILDDFNVKATFFLNTGDLLARPALQAAMIGASQNGHEIGAHTLTHPDLTRLSPVNRNRELEDAQIILENLIGKPVITLAYPFGAHNAAVEANTADYYIAARTVYPDALHPATGQNMYLLGEAPGPFNWNDSQFISSRLAFAQSAVDQGKWAIEMYHNLVGPGGINGELTHTEAALRGHLTNLTSGSLATELWVAPMGDVAQYYRSREESTLSTSFGGGDQMTVELTLADPTGRIATDLTLSTTVPGLWGEGTIEVRQADQLLPFTQSDSGVDIELKYNALPNGGDVLISVTPAGLAGDFDGDNDVDGADFLAWQRGFPSLFMSADLMEWRNHYGGVAASFTHLGGSSSIVPEPASIILLFVSQLFLGATRRRI